MKSKTKDTSAYSLAMKRLWRNPQYRRRMRQAMSSAYKQKWKDPRYRRFRKRAATRQWRDPVVRRRIQTAMKKRWRDPLLQRRMSRMMKARWRNPRTRKQLLATVCDNFGPSIGARALHALLGTGWIVEYWTRAGVVDLAYPPLKLAIEVDGDDHRHPRKQKRDRQKVRNLRRLGWSVLRVSEYGCRALLTLRGVK